MSKINQTWLQKDGTKQILILCFRLITFGLLLAALLISFLRESASDIVSENPLGEIGYFTNQSNILCALLLAYLIVRFFVSKKPETRIEYNIRGAITLAITITGLIFNFLLVPSIAGSDYAEQFRYWTYANVILHTFGPLLMVFDWLMFGRSLKQKWVWVFTWAIYPLIYVAVYWISGGLGRGVYPYFFMDPTAIGWGSCVLYLIVLIVVFVLIGLGLMALKRVIDKRLHREIADEA